MNLKCVLCGLESDDYDTIISHIKIGVRLPQQRVGDSIEFESDKRVLVGKIGNLSIDKRIKDLKSECITEMTDTAHRRSIFRYIVPLDSRSYIIKEDEIIAVKKQSLGGSSYERGKKVLNWREWFEEISRDPLRRYFDFH